MKNMTNPEYKTVKIIQKLDNTRPRFRPNNDIYRLLQLRNRYRRPRINQVISTIDNNSTGENNSSYIIPIINPNIQGCGGTRYGCCPDGVTVKNSNASNCHRRY